ncbi:MAG TPA: hypothetical protein DEO83_05760 [Lachnospiraceae bacterium]|nr:hypothetical protein [Lachnospiraceae bacterium]
MENLVFGVKYKHGFRQIFGKKSKEDIFVEIYKKGIIIELKRTSEESWWKGRRFEKKNKTSLSTERLIDSFFLWLERLLKLRKETSVWDLI